VGHVARSWVDVGSIDKCLVVRFMNFTALVGNILSAMSYSKKDILRLDLLRFVAD
jgi:hypothetical protein